MPLGVGPREFPLAPAADGGHLVLDCYLLKAKEIRKASELQASRSATLLGRPQNVIIACVRKLRSTQEVERTTKEHRCRTDTVGFGYQRARAFLVTRLNVGALHSAPAEACR